jgi:uncharacterized membrane protein HdeD (DUF308 family)
VGWREDVERMQSRTATGELMIVGPVALLAAVALFANARAGEGLVALVLGAVMTFFGVLKVRAERRERSFED